MTQISAKIKKTEGNRINQCDIFHDIDIVECITEGADGVSVSYIRFPLMICLNQDCDLNSDERDKWHYKIFCVNGNTGFKFESRIFYFIDLQNEEDYERKESSSAR